MEDRDRSGSRAGGCLVALSGLVASGKSTLARALSRQLGGVRIEADAIRARILDETTGGTRPPTSEDVVERVRSFEEPFEERVYRALLDEAEAQLETARVVVLDAGFPTQRARRAARELAGRHGLAFLLVECRIDPASAARRIAERDRAGRGSDWKDLSARFADHYEPVDELPREEHLAVDATRPVEEAVAAVEAALERLGHAPAAAAVADPRRLPTPPVAVTFDCWNTLLYEDDWPVAHAHRVDALVHAAVLADRYVARDEAARAFDVAWHQHMADWRRGVATGAREVARDGLVSLGIEPDGLPLAHLVREFENASHSGGVRALDGALDVLSALTDAGIGCALVCDTGLTPGHVVRLHLSRLGLLEHLAVQVFSDEQGVPKPHPRMFHAALGPLGAAPERSVHVGDLLRTDVAGARGVGMATVRLRARNDDGEDLPEADAVADSHAELLRLLLG